MYKRNLFLVGATVTYVLSAMITISSAFVPASPTQADNACTTLNDRVFCAYSGSPQRIFVPDGVMSAKITAVGGDGGSSRYIGENYGDGAYVTGTLDVHPGEALDIGVGAHGGNATGTGDPAGGWGGAGTSGGAGNAASDRMRTAAGGGGGTTITVLETDGSSTLRVIAAGGGGDAGPSGEGGASSSHGGDAGEQGWYGTDGSKASIWLSGSGGLGGAMSSENGERGHGGHSLGGNGGGGGGGLHGGGGGNGGSGTSPGGGGGSGSSFADRLNSAAIVADGDREGGGPFHPTAAGRRPLGTSVPSRDGYCIVQWEYAASGSKK